MQVFVASMKHQEPLNARDAFYGGRTGNTWKHYLCKEGEKIRYVDVCSLYPWVSLSSASTFSNYNVVFF